MARKPKFTDELLQQITEHLKVGCTVETVCAAVGIAESTFYQWVNAKPEFSEAVTRARAAAHQAATAAVHAHFTPTATRVQETVTIEETRLRKVVDKEGNEEQVPYSYKRTTTTERVTEAPPDWRAAIEYLKRRDSEHWSEKNTLEIEDWRTQAVKDIRDGKIAYKDLAEAFDEQLAAELFKKAGVPIPTD